MLSWKPWQLSVPCCSAPPALPERRREETDTCRSLIPFNTCIQRSPRFRHDIKIHRVLTRYIFDGLLFSKCHITRCTHQKLQTVLATVHLILLVKHLSEEIWISLPSLYFLLSSNGTWQMIDRSCQGRNRLFSLASVMGFAYGHLRWRSKGRTWEMPCRPFWHWIAMAEYNFPLCYMHLHLNEVL